MNVTFLVVAVSVKQLQQKQKMRYSKLSDDIEFLMQEESGSRKQNTKHIKYQYKYKYKYKYRKVYSAKATADARIVNTDGKNGAFNGASVVSE